MNLVIDIGNTLSKVAIFDEDNLLKHRFYHAITRKCIDNLIAENPGVNRAIIALTGKSKTTLTTYIHKTFDTTIVLNETTSIPITNLYKTPETLGPDRIANACGANHISPNTNILVIDAGTAITFDYMSQNNEFLGGNISPGIHLRFKALAANTSKLPLLEKDDTYPDIGANTKEAVLAGVLNGIVFETERYMNHFIDSQPGGKIFLTGGNAKFLEKRIKNRIFVVPELSLIGLNYILNYHVNK